MHRVGNEEDVSGECLHAVGHDADGKAAEVRTPETLEIVWTAALEAFLETEGLADVCQLVGYVDWGCCEAAQGGYGVGVAAFAAEPVGRVGDEVDQGEHDAGEGPLGGDGDFIRIYRVNWFSAFEDSRRDERADGEGQVGHCCCEAAQDQRGDLADVGRGTYRVEGDDAAVDELADEELGWRLAEELDEDEGDGQDRADCDHDPGPEAVVGHGR